jgi:hypothetical protein
MKPTGILALLSLSACANLPPPTASYPNLPKEGSSDEVHDQLDGSTAHPTTLTAGEAQKAAEARFDSPLILTNWRPKRQSRFRLLRQQERSTPGMANGTVETEERSFRCRLKQLRVFSVTRSRRPREVSSSASLTVMSAVDQCSSRYRRNAALVCSSV